MKYFAVFSPMLDKEKSQKYRTEHLAFLKQKAENGFVFAKGRFTDGAGGLVIYRADSYEEAEAIVQNDPYVIKGARSYDIHEWDMTVER